VEIEFFKVTIADDNTIAERNRNYINYRGELRYAITKCCSKNTEGDIYNKKIGIVVALLKSLGFSRRIVGKVSDVLLEELNRKLDS
jgi:hypothetical protein